MEKNNLRKSRCNLAEREIEKSNYGDLESRTFLVRFARNHDRYRDRNRIPDRVV